MPSLPMWRRYLRFWGPDIDADVDDELRFHLDQLAVEFEAQGLAPDDAKRAAAARFGNVAEIEHQLRQHDRRRDTRKQRIDMVRDFAGQLRVAARGLRRTPAFTLTAIITLMLGIGFSTGVFAVAHKLLLEPLPVRDESALLVLSGRTPDGRIPNFPLGMERVRLFVPNARSLEQVALFTYQSPLPKPVLNGEGILRLRQSQVSGNFFTVLGAGASLGRLLVEGDDAKGSDPVAVLSYDAWQQHYASDPKILGKRLQVYSAGITYTVVGVARRGFAFPHDTEYWVTIAASTPESEEGFLGVNLVGRLAAGRSAQNARDELSSFYARPNGPVETPKVAAVVKSLRTVVLGDTRPAILTFSVAVVLLLLLTCINVAALTLVRGLTRRQELAVRSALGARRSDLVSLLMIESGLLAVVGGTLGVAFAAVGLKMFVAFAPTDLPRLSEVGLSGSSLLAAVAITIVSLFVFAVVPALSQSDVAVGKVLRSGTRQSAGRRSRRGMEGLVAAQIALALVIVSAAALISQSLINLQRAQLAFESSHLLVGDLAFRSEEYDVVGKQTKLFDRLLPAIGAIPGVIAVSPAVAAPFSGVGGWDARLVADGQSQIEARNNPLLNLEVVTPDYFRALGLRVLKGRALDDTDREGAVRAIVVSQSTAAYYWPGQDPIGKHLAMPPDRLPLTVVGVVDDTRYRDLRDPRPSIYVPQHQSFFPFGPTTIVIRTVVSPETVIPALRQVVASTAPGVTIARVAPFDQFMRAPLALPRMNTFLLIVFATAAALLAAVGLFGVMVSLVRHRTREIGIRMALGASPREVQSMVLKRGLTIAGAGVAAGWLGALLGNRAVRSMLYEVSPTDLSTFGVATALLIVIALVATALPARTAMRVDPGVALRADV